MEGTVEDDKVTVKKVCQDFRIREDGALASKLQEEEFQKHYIKNKSERRTVRGDVRVAKQTYLEEVRTAHLLPEEELVDMEETDKWLARDLQEKLHNEERREIERQAKVAARDAKMAKTIQEREKDKFDREWHRRREEERMERDRLEREQREVEHQEVDKQTELERRDAQLARDLQERERERYERERQRYMYERERQRRKEKEMMRMDEPEIDRQKELEMRDARIARDLQEREKQKFDREWQRRREQEILEQQERRHYQRSASEPAERERDARRPAAKPSTETITVNGHTEPEIQRRNRPGSGREDQRKRTEREDKRKSTGSGGSGGSIGKDERKPKQEQEAVVPVSTPENGGGGRLEHDRIIMADGTEIHLFENEEEKQKDKQKDLDLERIKKDEEYAKMLQDQERRIVQAEKMAAEDKRRALEEQDRELARHLQRKEYHRMQQERKERQMRRANSVPQDRLTVNLQDPRRLPSYEEATYRRQMPDLLPENNRDNDCNRYSYVSTNSSSGVGSNPSSLERETNLAHVEEGKHFSEQDRGRSPRDLITRGPQHPSERRDVEPEDHRYERDYGENRHPSRQYENTQDEREGRHSPRDSGYMKDHSRDDGERGYTRDDRDPPREQGHTDRHPPQGFARDGRHPPQEYARDDRHPPQGYASGERDDRHTPRDHRSMRDQIDGRHSPRDHGSIRDERENMVRSQDHQDERQPSPTDYTHLIPEKENPDTNSEQPVWLTREPEHTSPPSSLERSHENLETNPETVLSSYASGQNSYDRKSNTSGSPPSRADIWERFEDDEEDDSYLNRQIVRSRTVASSQPTNHERPLSFNVVEGIDPTFRRKPKNSEDDPKDQNSEKTKVIQLIKPQRRRSTEKKKEQKKSKKREL